MTNDLVPCAEDQRYYCMNGGQCYMFKADQNVFQCSCHTPYYGARCERTAVDREEYKQLEHLLSKQTKLVAIFGALFVSTFVMLLALSVVLWKKMLLGRKNKKHLNRTQTTPHGDCQNNPEAVMDTQYLGLQPASLSTDPLATHSLRLPPDSVMSQVPPAPRTFSNTLHNKHHLNMYEGSISRQWPQSIARSGYNPPQGSPLLVRGPMAPSMISSIMPYSKSSF